MPEVTISRNKRLKPSESSFDLAQLHRESTIPTLLPTVAMEYVTYMFDTDVKLVLLIAGSGKSSCFVLNMGLLVLLYRFL